MTRRILALDFAAIALIVTEPLVHFAYTQGLVFEFVTVALLAVHLVAALLMALLINRYPNRLFRVVAYAGLVVLYLDLRVEVIGSLGAGVLLLFAGVLAAVWLLHVHSAKVLVAVFGVILVSNLFEPVNPAVKENLASRQPGAESARGLPVYVHLVLDEFLGVEAFDPENAEQKALRQEIIDLFVDNGFRLFGRAYAEYNQTMNTLSAGFNEFTGDNPHQFFEQDDAKNKVILLANRYFEGVFSKGYEINVVQSSFFDFCNSEVPVVSRCLTYKIGSFSGESLTPFDTAEKFDLVLSAFWRRSFIKRFVHRVYAYTQVILGVIGFDLPSWPFIRDLSTWHIQQLPVYDRLVAEIASAPGGRMYFAHFLLPHHPYPFDRQCRFRRPLMDWDRAFMLEALPDGRHNTAQSRARRYDAYVGQVRCTLSKIDELLKSMRMAGTYDDATIIIHGDHGSRIVQYWPLLENREHLMPQDFFDSYSTLFAVKAPHVSAGYDKRMLPLNYLLRLAENRESTIRDPAGEHYVYMLERAFSGPLTRVPMPEIPNPAGVASEKAN